MKNSNIDFRIPIDSSKNTTPQSIINKPITCEGKAVGVITECIIDESERYFNCKGIIWSKFLNTVFWGSDNSKELSSITIG